MTQEVKPNPNSESEIANIKQEAGGDVTLTLRKEKFAEFIFEFLGPKETLSKDIEAVFIVTMPDLLQFHHLLTQKVAKEQFISLTLETATIHYDDDTSRTINTFGAIESYSEHRDVGVRSFNMSWSFVFKDPDKETLQRQVVSVFFQASSSNTGSGMIKIKIEHTNQVWAAEVLRLFEEHISKLISKNTAFFRSLRLLQRLRVFGIIATALTFMAMVGFGYLIFQRQKFQHPIKVRNEFVFDMAQVVATNYEEREIDILLQFFLIRDLRNEPTSVISSLRATGHFNSKYDEVIDKLISGYYDTDEDSNRLINYEILKEQIQAIKNIAWAFWYLKFVFFYLVAYFSAGIFLRVFRIKSVLAITSKGLKQAEKQQRDKSGAMQFVFGVSASILATVIYSLVQTLIFPR